MSELTNRAGVAAAQLAVNKIGWFFREQPISDQGVDAIVEDVVVKRTERGHATEEGTGRLLALQIKGGPSWFAEKSADGWWFRFSATHANRWLNLAIPLVVVLVDTESDTCYWQAVSPNTIVEAGQGFKVDVPASHRVLAASEAWRVLASRAAADAEAQLDNSVAHLPPSVADVIPKLGPDGPLTAYHLAEGRHNAEGTVETLLAARPLWLQRSAPHSWLAVGRYANCHGYAELAAQSFERAAETADGEANRAKWLAAAAIQLIYVDHARADELLDRAEAAGADARTVAVARAVMAHPSGDANPIELPKELEGEDEDIRSSAFIQSFLAIHSQRIGDIQAALNHAALALAAEPSSAGLMVHRGEVLLWATLAGHSDPQLPLEGMKLLRQALEQMHQWSGPTLDATLELARAGLLYGQLHLTLDACLAAPEGSAAPSVAQDPRVRRLAMAAAAGLGRDDLADRLAQSLSYGATDQLAKVRAGRLTATDEQRREWLREDLADAIQGEDFMRVAQCSLELAELGVDSNRDIEALVTRSILPEETPRFLSALAAAHSNLDSAIPELRALARTNRQAGGVLVDLLQQAGRIDEAIGICDMILELRREPAALASRAQLLIRARHDDAENVAVATAAELNSFATVRRDLLTFAAQMSANRGEWDLAERRLEDALAAAGQGDPDAVWRLVVAQLNTGYLDRASYTIAKHDPDVTSVEQAELWLQAHAATPLDAVGAAKALELAEKFNHPKISTGLLGLIITNTAGTADANESDEPDQERLGERRRLALTSVPAELHRKAFDILNRLVEEHGDATGVSVLKVDGEDPVTQLVDVLKASRKRDEVLAEYAIKAQQAQIPIGLLSALAGRGYATTLIQRALGLLTGASPDDEEGDSEVEAAAAAINAGVVADASALLTASGDIDDLTMHFASVTLPAATLRDIHRAGSDIRGAAGSPGSIRLDHEAGIPILTPLHPEEFVRQLRRSEDLVKLAASLPSRPVTVRDALSELADEPRFSPWVDPIRLAHELGRALWSDDLAVRRLARSTGVNAFGTPGLVTAINEKAAATITGDRIAEVIEKAMMRNRSMAADRIVDLHFGFGDIFSLARSEAWEPAAAALAISRPSWWAWNEMRMDELIPLFTAVRAELPEAIGAWQISAMTGAAHAVPDAVGRSRVLCTLALLGWDHNDPLTHLRDSMQRARAVAESLGHPDPARELAAVAGLPEGDQDDEVDAEISHTILVLAEELGFPIDDG